MNFYQTFANKPDDVGLSSERLAVMADFFENEVNKNLLPGVIALIIKKEKIAFLKKFGYSDIQSEKNTYPDTIFRIYSMTKPIISIGLLTLYEKGLFKLNDPVSKYLPELGGLKVLKPTNNKKNFNINYVTVPSKREMTIHDLLRQTSGISGGRICSPFMKEIYIENKLINYKQPLKTMIEKLGKLPLANHPGTAWEYGESYDVLGRLIEVISRITLDEFLYNTIFKPLEMHNTNFYVPKNKLNKLVNFEDEATNDMYNSDYTKAPIYLSGSLGCFSSISDYSRFLTMLYNKGTLGNVRILGSKTVELMTNDHLGHLIGTGPDYIPGAGYGYGLGVAVRINQGLSSVPGSIGDYNWVGKASTSFFIDPKEELIGIFMTQKLNSALHYQSIFKTLVYQTIL